MNDNIWDVPDGLDDSDGWDGLDADVINMPQPEPISDGQSLISERFVTLYGDAFRYVPGLGWLEYDGTKWAPGNGGYAGLRAEQAIVETARTIISDHDANKSQQQAAADIFKRDTNVKGALGYLKRHPKILTPVDTLNTDPMLFNVANGTVDLRSGELRKHDPDDLITLVAGTEYDASAVGQRWHRFLREALEDPALINAVAQCFGGAGLPGNVVEHVYPVIYGPAATGKTTFYTVISAAFGDYAITVEPELLLSQAGAHPTGLMDLMGRRLAFASESDEGRKLNTATMKRLTGGDRIRARRMHQDFIEFAPSHLVALVTNHLPKMPAGDDPAVWRRIRVVPFDKPPQKPDKRLTAHLLDELPAVLAWLVKGHASFLDDGIQWPGQVTEATDSYRSQSDLIGQFLGECTEKATAMESIGVGDLYRVWKDWIHNNADDAKPGRTGDFTQKLREAGEDVESVVGKSVRSSIRGRRLCEK